MNSLRNASRLIQSLLQCPSQSTWPAEPDLSQLTRWHCLIQGIGDQNLALCLVMDVQTNRWQGTTQISQLIDQGVFPGIPRAVMQVSRWHIERTPLQRAQPGKEGRNANTASYPQLPRLTIDTSDIKTPVRPLDLNGLPLLQAGR